MNKYPMIAKSIIASAILLVALSASSQGNNSQNSQAMVLRRDVICMRFEEIIELLKKEYGEVPAFIGEPLEEDQRKANAGGMVIFLNARTGGYTIVEAAGKTGCVVSAGKNFTAINTKPIVYH